MWADNNDFGISLLGCHLENQAASVVLLVPVHIPYCLRKLPLSWNGNKYRIQSHIASKCCVYWRILRQVEHKSEYAHVEEVYYGVEVCDWRQMMFRAVKGIAM